MIPKVHKRGSGFKGLAHYLLHDAGSRETAERVAWTETRNLATRDPHTAWRVMSATSMSQDRLKQAAGIKNTGRKSREHVMHLSLSWHPDEAADLTRAEMVRAATGAINAIGADDREALIVAHSDTPQKHVHIVLNRVCSATGRLLASSHERRKLSAWAEAYERERGEVLCEQRALNNAGRRRGEYTRGEKDRPRHLYELEAANANSPDAPAIKHEQHGRDAELSARTRSLRKSQERAFEQLEREHRARLTSIDERARQAERETVRSIRERHRPRWAALFRAHRAELRDFDRGERTFAGRLKNAWKALDLGGAVREGRPVSAISDAFTAFASAGRRRALLERKQRADTRALGRVQRAEEHEAVSEVRRARSRDRSEARSLYAAERSSLVLKAAIERSHHRALWRARRTEREAAWSRARPAREQDGLTREFEKRAPSLEDLLARRLSERGRDIDDDRGR